MESYREYLSGYRIAVFQVRILSCRERLVERAAALLLYRDIKTYGSYPGPVSSSTVIHIRGPPPHSFPECWARMVNVRSGEYTTFGKMTIHVAPLHQRRSADVRRLRSLLIAVVFAIIAESMTCSFSPIVIQLLPELSERPHIEGFAMICLVTIRRRETVITWASISTWCERRKYTICTVQIPGTSILRLDTIHHWY